MNPLRALLVLAGVASWLICLLSAAGHFPYTNLGMAMIPLAFLTGAALFLLSAFLSRASQKRQQDA